MGVQDDSVVSKCAAKLMRAFTEKMAPVVDASTCVWWHVSLPLTPSGQAKRLMTELVMTPPKTPPPAGLTPKRGGPEQRFFPANDRLRALRVETGA